jgi:transposase
MTEKQVRAQYTQEFKLEAVRQVRNGQAPIVSQRVV